ncbi:hypothetical protein U1701_11235 [Sphingomonas sp. PB2P19]|uniref:hypothetical protein n=1 Tax=Sphingomonas rhamnosi TaxID=3096156 RepID=UPI002FCC7335
MALAAGAMAQDVPVDPRKAPPEIVVEGERPHVDAGAWTIHKWPSRTVIVNSGSAGRGVSTTPGWTARTCIADEALDDAIARLLGRDNAVTQPGCSRMRIRIAKGRLTGRKDCTRMMAVGGDLRPAVMASATRYTGILAPTRIDVRLHARTQDNGEDVAEMTGRLTAERTGACPAPAPTPAVPVAGPAARGAPDGGSAAIRAVSPSPAPSLAIPGEDRPANAASVTTPIEARARVAAAQESADDIVVVARRLRKLRLRYASIGRILSSCRPEISSGDARVDRIGCAIVRACVRAGFGERGPDIACFRRKVDSLAPD